MKINKDTVTLLEVLLLSQAFLEKYDKLSHTPFFKQNIKMAMKGAERALNPIADQHLIKVFGADEEQTQEGIEAYSYLSKLLGECNVIEIISIYRMLKAIDDGKINIDDIAKLMNDDSKEATV
jgi:hypothetical protein